MKIFRFTHFNMILIEKPKLRLINFYQIFLKLVFIRICFLLDDIAYRIRSYD